MDAARWDTIQTLFDAALDRPPAEREPFLRAACADDEALYREVASLLDVEVHTILDGLAVDAVDLPAVLSMEGERVGPYRIEREAGRGGMGAVYRAERVDGAFAQTVALKLVKRGMDSEAVLGRFLAERQILARLNHPHIARLLDGGLHADGRPYFAMEFVEGEPITRYCDARALGVDDRLALFEKVAESVAYAHRALVVHRDLKPSNILVTEEGEVKLLDFGIAKLLDAGDASATWSAPRPMTPEYAAPEQLRGEPTTTATDVYALGVLLFELLTGRRPHSRDRHSLAADSTAHDTTLPSTSVGQSVTTQTADGPATVTPAGVSQARSTTPEKLRRRLAGDLDTLVLKALRPEPEERYGSVELLLADLRRERAGTPILARPATVRYRMRKFVARHRLAVATAVGVALVLVGVVTVYTARLADERDRARLEAEKAAASATFLTGLFEQADPLESLGDTLTVFGLLDAGAQRMEWELAGQPVLRAQLLQVLGEVYANLGDYSHTEALLRDAVALYRAHAPRDPGLALALRDLGTTHRRLGRLDDAEAALTEALALHERVGSDPAERARTLRAVGALAQQRGAYDEAEATLREALTMQRTALPPTSPDLSATLNDLAELFERLGRFGEAEEAITEAIAIDRAAFGPRHPRVATDLVNFGVIAREQGNAAAAERAYREALVIHREILGEDHPETATVMRNLGSLLRDQEQYDEAAALYDRALAIRRARFGPEHPRVANLLNSYGTLHAERGDLDAAARTYREVLATYRALPQVEPALLATALHNLAAVLEDQEQPDEAERLYRESLAVLRSGLPPGSSDIGFPLTSLGTILVWRGAYQEAAELLREAVTLRRAVLPNDHRLTALSERRLSDALVGIGEDGQAAAILTESIARLHETDADPALVERASARLGTLADR